LLTNQDIKKICEEFFFPNRCVVDMLADYENAIKLTLLDENKKMIKEETFSLSEVCDRQELDIKKLASRLNSLRELYRTKRL
jgi:flagellar capping protein FliD